MTPALICAASEMELITAWLTPFYRVTTLKLNRKRLALWLAPFLESGKPVFAQIMGTNAAELVNAGKLFLELGAAGIDLNCGCPSAQVVRHGGGGGMLRDTENMLAIFAALREGLPSGAFLSIKLRTGFAAPDYSWLPRLAELRPDMVFLHYRAVSEHYKALPFELAMERFTAARHALGNGVRVVANGDINTLEKRDAVLNLGYCGVMTARGWLADPELLREFGGAARRSPLQTVRRELFFRTLAAAEGDFSNGRALELARMLWGRDNAVLRALRHAPPDAWQQLTAEVLADV